MNFLENKSEKKKLKLKSKKKPETIPKKFIPPKLFFWSDLDKNLTARLSDYAIIELDEEIEKSYLDWRTQKINEIKCSELWKPLPKDDSKIKKSNNEKMQIIRKQMEWEKKEREYKIKCNFLKIKYDEPLEFPTSYKVYNVKTDKYKNYKYYYNYRWTTKDDTEYSDVWNDWVRNDNYRRNKLENIIEVNTESFKIDKRIEKWETLNEEQKQSIIKKEKDFNLELKKKRNNQSSRMSFQDTKETERAPNGMVVVREPWMTNEQWSEERSNLKEAYRDSLK